MGKKNKGKRGQGAEKTAIKTERQANKKVKKALLAQGEEDIESLIAHFQEKDRKTTNVSEEKCTHPSPRSGMSLTAHPDKDELIIFGGEFYNGSKTFMYNDLFFYNTKKNDWTNVKSPNTPPPRSSHQAVALKQGGGQLWIFGGEFASPTQSQFYHYKDLWVYHLGMKTWEMISAPGAPSSRSGHRMVAFRKTLVIFGGFHDNLRDYKYYNDVHVFNLETRTWQKIEIVGTPPSPRSGGQLAVLQDQSRIMVYGGYSKVPIKKDVDKGTAHSDMFMLCPDGENRKEDTTPTKWKWMNVKQSGMKASPRCGFSLAVATGDRGFLFGGVYDVVDDEEDLKGTFYNELFMLELDKSKWHEVELKGKLVQTEAKKRRRRQKGTNENAMDDDIDGDGGDDIITDVSNEVIARDIDVLKMDEEIAMEMDEGVQQLDVNTPSTSEDEGVFTVTMGSSESKDREDCKMDTAQARPTAFVPTPRSNAALAVKSHQLYMYGGLYEMNDMEVTLDDMHSLDLNKMDEWTVLVAGTMKPEWIESETSSDSESDDELDMDIPIIQEDEAVADYFARTREFWVEVAEQSLKDDDICDPTPKQTKKHATELAETHYKNMTVSSK